MSNPAAPVCSFLVDLVALPLYASGIPTEAFVFCRYCGSDIPDDSVFCYSCGKSLARPASSSRIVPEPSPIVRPPQPQPSQQGKKIFAGVLIAFLSLMLIGANAALSKDIHKEEDWAYLFGELLGVGMIVAALIFSIKWELQLSGHVNTSGRQAVAIFLCAFCVWGLLLVLMSFGVSMSEDAPSMMFLTSILIGLLYIVGLCCCILWLKKLKRNERAASAGRLAS